MYSRCGKVWVARQVFDRMESRNVFAWTAMINGYVSNGHLDEAVILFREMQIRDGIPPNNVSLVSILPACSSLAALIGGKQIHGYSIRRMLNSATSFANALIDMYFRCGSICYAQRVFENENFLKDSISWSSVISGFGMHGRGRDAVCTFNKMLGYGIRPDMITLIGVLSACSRSGLVKEGIDVYDTAINEYGMKPSLEACACMVDMLGRAGQLKDALDFVQQMPIKPGPSVWGALINACIAYGDSEMLELAYGVLIHLEPENPSNYVSLSNVCALSRKWDVVAKVRTMMKVKGLRKTPGLSWIDVNNQTHHFYVADKQHYCSELIYELLDHLSSMMKRVNIDFDLMNFT
uniref:Pentatricopeptide repeat-containing protein n=1 Tax=Kalanchoe fedtschenkoi TaxID=63787 RepID=A0A7N0U723_KALFE